MWIGVLQRSPQCGNLRHALTDPYYLGRFLQVEGKKKRKKEDDASLLGLRRSQESESLIWKYISPSFNLQTRSLSHVIY